MPQVLAGAEGRFGAVTGVVTTGVVEAGGVVVRGVVVGGVVVGGVDSGVDPLAAAPPGTAPPEPPELALDAGADALVALVLPEVALVPPEVALLEEADPARLPTIADWNGSRVLLVGVAV